MSNLSGDDLKTISGCRHPRARHF